MDLYRRCFELMTLNKRIPAMPTTTCADDRKPIPNIPPLNWQSEVPRYRVTRAVRPSPNDRHRREPPFSNFSDGSVWQYAERQHEAGEILATTFWPHPMFFPLNFSAKKVLEFHQSCQKSRLPRSPWNNDQVRLDDGLTGTGPTMAQIAPPPLKRVDLRPVRF